ncbi:hypothetical protein CJF42_24235 [Pseudoalteromonas sp. NBT06-2]|uniref:helix-turn-helix transcriptional regulator n=1 Tax=Pseudoalteromonas sp. NBT06-2 TaxID=2025950 RepID=UPI000BA6EF2A|nr:AlpA family phage regulatory protein [Pseudoalteromonas sp. NBT06-2]PAJ71899.1 hypothetical protein CJF42_24235 [Pseudoalteromonas sp. NBT06-2]
MNTNNLYRTNIKGEEIQLRDRIIRPKEVAEICGMSRVNLYRLKNKFKFPPSIRISEARVGWLESDIEEWKKLGAENFYIVYGEQLKDQALARKVA